MTADLLERASKTTRAILTNVAADQYDRDTPCASWDVRALVNHVIGSTRWFAETVTTGVAPDSSHGEYQPDVTDGDIVAAYDTGIAAAISAFRSPGAMEKVLKLPFGEMPGSAFAMMATADQFQHAWDLARATGQPTDLDPDIAAQLLQFATAAIPDAFRGPDGVAPFGPVVDATTAAATSDKLAGFLGRRL